MQEERDRSAFPIEEFIKWARKQEDLATAMSEGYEEFKRQYVAE